MRFFFPIRPRNCMFEGESFLRREWLGVSGEDRSMVKRQRGAWYFCACMVVVLLAGLAWSAPVLAQTFRGTIIGTVSDPTGGVLAGATVTAKNAATGLTRTTTTSE